MNYIFALFRYQFNDEIHEVIAGDTEPVYIPKKSHSVTHIAARMKRDEEHRKKFKDNQAKPWIDPV